MSDDERAREGLPDGLTADVRALIEMMARGGITELSLKTGAVQLRLRSGTPASAPHQAPPAAIHQSVEAPVDSHLGITVNAPMIGTFYRAPAPNEPNFVEDGDLVETGQTIGLIEAMKIMNEIPCEVAGIVSEFLVANGQPVEFGQPLARIMPAS